MSGIVLALFSGSSCRQEKESEDFSVGFQLYSVRRDLQADFTGTLKKVKDMGFDGVEFYAEYYGRTPAEVRALCDELGLEIFSNHVPFNMMVNSLDQVIEDNKVLGATYIAFPYMSSESHPGVDPEKFKQTVAMIAEVGEKVRKEGFQLLYHNHDFEFATLPDGTVGHDYIFSSADPSAIHVELDVCWSDFAGFDGEELVKKYSGRLPVLHLKDYYQSGKLASDPYALIGLEDEGKADSDAGKFEFRPLGDGVVDIPAIIEVARESGVRWLCIEQDEPASIAKDAFEGPARSMEYLRKLGIVK